ncbi:MAG: septum formation inhibitor Maf [Acidobacteriota bacterium]|nr:septum formation inhibitor Maf [Acidobacteriota bacterium]
MNIIARFLLLIPAWFLLGCGVNSEELVQSITNDPAAFQAYWYNGQAELTRYKLRQSRYGAQHEGDAVHIFVTEPFLAGKQVKQDYQGEGESYPVLKLNKTKHFLTGIYPYTLMTSVFSEVKHDGRHTPKVSFSSQEWCGNMYAQLNLRGDDYQVVSHSYFQGEADQNFKVDNVWLEDEIWGRIRMAPNHLPVDDIKMIPSMEHALLRHVAVKPMDVQASLYEEKDRRFAKHKIYMYELEYKESKRKLVIYFEREAPYAILGWREIDGEGRETIAVRTNTIRSDYWNHNRPENRKMRNELGLNP